MRARCGDACSEPLDGAERFDPMTRILFFTWRAVLRRYGDVVKELVHGGHEVVIASPAQVHRRLPGELRELQVRDFGYEEMSDPERGRAIRLLRNTRDYLWYLSPEQEAASFNRRHALDRLIRGVTAGDRGGDRSWPDPIVQPDPEVRITLDAAFATLERQIPCDPGIVELIRRQDPDVVLVSPLVKQQFHQAEVVKAAQSLGIRTAFLVYSWDNLSNKGRVHVPPDRTFVWNDLQRREAVELHGLDPQSVVITGAPHWDAFFRMQPSTQRDDFCLGHGFDPARPIVLYLGSTERICPDEPLVVERWLDAVRQGREPLRDANILVRRHPHDKEKWAGWRPRHERVSLSRHPRQQDQSLYDELHHAAAAVGLNTSAQIEASILGKPVYTFSAGNLAPGQAGTLHFYYLLKKRGGVVSWAETLEEHVAQLERGVAGEYDREAVRRFCETFVRPHGLDRPVAPIVAEQLVALAANGRRVRVPLGWFRTRADGRWRARAAVRAAD
jgi:hypothetical protein